MRPGQRGYRAQRTGERCAKTDPADDAAAPRIVARRGASWPSHTPAMAAAAGSTNVVAPPTSPLSMSNTLRTMVGASAGIVGRSF